MKRFAILTSGGDCAAMNKVVTTFVRVCELNKIEAYLIYEGFKGLVNGNIKKTTFNEIRKWYDLPGTEILSSRFEDFENLDYQKKAVEQLNKNKIDSLLICGGNGSYMGANALSKLGIKVACLPGTIDNDVWSSEMSIGFSSSLEFVVNSIRNIRATMESYKYVSVIEIMGRAYPDLTTFASIATDADYTIISENTKTAEEFASILKKIRKDRPNQSIIVLVSEHLYDGMKLPKLIDFCDEASEIIGEKIRINVIGYAQRGAIPSAWDLVISTKMTTKAVEELIKNNFGFAVGIKKNKIVCIDLDKSLRLKKPNNLKIVKKFINFNY